MRTRGHRSSFPPSFPAAAHSAATRSLGNSTLSSTHIKHVGPNTTLSISRRNRERKENHEQIYNRSPQARTEALVPTPVIPPPAPPPARPQRSRCSTDVHEQLNIHPLHHTQRFALQSLQAFPQGLMFYSICLSGILHACNSFYLL